MYFGFEHISVCYGRKCVLQDLSLDVPRGKIVSLIGPNGCGKSSLLKTVVRAVSPVGGRVVLDGRPIEDYAPRALARRMAYLPQMYTLPADVDVRTLITYGRYPHRSFGRGLGAADRAVIDRVLALTDLTALQDRPLATLSGGERQRARIAMSVAQEPEILILDEPTTYLDIAHQLEVMELVRTLNSTLGITVLAVLHDLNLAARYSDLLCVLHRGGIYRTGSPDQVLTVETLREVFGIDARLLRDEAHQCPYFIGEKHIEREGVL